MIIIMNTRIQQESRLLNVLFSVLKWPLDCRIPVKAEITIYVTLRHTAHSIKQCGVGVRCVLVIVNESWHVM